MSTQHPESYEEKRICHQCVGEAYLKDLIRSDGVAGYCSYCDDEEPTFSMEEVADRLEQAFDAHYYQTSSEPDDLEYALDSDMDWERDGEQTKWAILNALNVSEDIADDLQEILSERHSDFEKHKMGEECPFDEDAHYADKGAGHGEFQMLWREFERNIKTQSRIFSAEAKAILDRIFYGISTMRTTQGNPIVITAGPLAEIHSLFRARVFAVEDGKLREALRTPWKELGTPSPEAAGAGRMNSRGIAVFYGTLDPGTALSEVRPPVGSKVAVASFKISRPLRLLDLSALRSVAAGGSIFDPTMLQALQRANFLEELSGRMSRAVMPHEEAVEYLPTQVVADYLACEGKLDGIVFPSVQTGHQSSNVILFHHAARVSEVRLPKGTKVEVSLDTSDSDGTHPDYRVWEKVPESVAANPTRDEPLHWRADLHHCINESFDSRQHTLEIELDTIQVSHVTAIRFGVETHSVSRHRFEQSPDLSWMENSNPAGPISDDSFG